MDKRSDVEFVGLGETLEFSALSNRTAYEYYKFDAVNSSGDILQYAEVELFGDRSEGVDPYAEIWTTVQPGDVGTAFTDDFDGDGINNIYEYALGGDPEANLSMGSPEIFKVGNMLEYVHRIRTNDSDLMYSVECSTDLEDGKWLSTGFTLATNITGDVFNEITSMVPISEKASYIRLKVVRPSLAGMDKKNEELEF